MSRFVFFILDYKKNPEEVFVGDHELPFDVAKKHYQPTDEHETQFQLGRLGIGSASLTGWEAFRYHTKSLRWQQAQFDLTLKARDYSRRNPLPHHVTSFRYFNPEKLKYLQKLAVTEVICADYPLEPHERACVHDFFTKLAPPKKLSIQIYPTMGEVMELLEFLIMENSEIGTSCINELHFVNTSAKKNYSFPTKDFLSAFQGELPEFIQALFERSFETLNCEHLEGADKYLLRFPSSPKVRLLINLDSDCKFFEMKIYRNTDVSETSGQSRFIPEREFSCYFSDDEVVITRDEVAKLDSVLHDRIKQFAQVLISDDPDAREKIEKLFSGMKSELATADNLDYYVTAVKKFILDLLIKASDLQQISSPADLSCALRKVMESDSSIWNMIPVEELQKDENIHDNNEAFKSVPLVIPEYVKSKESEDKLRAMIDAKCSRRMKVEGLKGKKILTNYLFSESKKRDEETHIKKINSLPPDVKVQYLDYLKYINDAGTRHEQLRRLAQIRVYVKLFDLEDELGKMILDLPVNKSKARQIIGDFFGKSIKIIRGLNSAGEIRLLLDINDLSKERQEKIRAFWSRMRDCIEAGLNRGINIGGDCWPQTALAGNPADQMSQLVFLFNAISEHFNGDPLSPHWNEVLFRKCLTIDETTSEIVDEYEAESLISAYSSSKEGGRIIKSAKKNLLLRKAHFRRAGDELRRKVENGMSLGNDELQSLLLKKHAEGLIHEDEKRLIERYARKLIEKAAIIKLESQSKKWSEFSKRRILENSENYKKELGKIKQGLYLSGYFNELVKTQLEEFMKTEEFQRRVKIDLKKMGRLFRGRFAIISGLKTEAEELEGLLGDYKKVFLSKKGGRLRRLLVKYANEDIEFITKLLLSDASRKHKADFGQVLIFVYEELNEESMLEFLNQVGLIPYFYLREEGDHLLYENNRGKLNFMTDLDPEKLPVALKKLFDRIVALETYELIAKMVTNHVDHYSEERHLKASKIGNADTLSKLV